jgi:hypothetical protein
LRNPLNHNPNPKAHIMAHSHSKPSHSSNIPNIEGLSPITPPSLGIAPPTLAAMNFAPSATPSFNRTPDAEPAATSQRSQPKATHGEIAARAYQLYCNSGYQAGKCDRNWLQAEVDLRGAMARM